MTATEAVETRLALDMVKRSLPFIPAVVILAAVIRGADGAWAAVVAVGIVLFNLVLSALGLAWAARKGPNALMAVALGGFLVRMGIVTAVVWAVKDTGSVDLPTLAVAVLVTHLGLLAWELRYVSASLAYPGLKPAAVKEEASRS